MSAPWPVVDIERLVETWIVGADHNAGEVETRDRGLGKGVLPYNGRFGDFVIEWIERCVGDFDKCVVRRKILGACWERC